MNLYFTSVGRNGKLLLNVPPTREGLLHASDVARLREFRERRDARFAEDVMRARRHEWRTTGDRTARLEVHLAEPVTVTVARLAENIARGQRVARYTLEGAEREDDAWRNLSSGTTIGYAKLDRFPATRLRRIRLTIEDAAAAPEPVTIKLFE
jgi:alpha-L-fucosidase